MNNLPYINLSARATAIVFDDHVMYAESFSSFIEKIGFFANVHTYTNSEDLLDCTFRLNGNTRVYLFADYYLGNGKVSLPLINDIRRIYKSIHIVIISCVTNPILIHNLLSNEIDGILSKASGTNEVRLCIQQIENGKRYISPIISQMIQGYDSVDKIPFSAREIEILGHFAQGKTVNDTAAAMQLSKHTIVSHRRRMMKKTNTNSITELLAYARKLELI